MPTSKKNTPPCSREITGKWKVMRRDMLEEFGTERLTVELVEQMLRNLKAADDALKTAMTNPLSVNQRGQESEHPGFRIASRCQREAMATAKALGMFEGREDEAKPQDSITELRDELAARRTRRTG